MDTPIEVLAGNLTMTNSDCCDATLTYEPAMGKEGLQERWTHWAEVAHEYMIDYWTSDILQTPLVILGKG